MNKGKRSSVPSRVLAMAAALAAITPAVQAEESSLKVDGYLRQELSWNLLNWADTPGYDDRRKLSMFRTTVRVNSEWKATDDITVVGKFRASRESKTDFLRHLEKMGANNYGSANGRGDIMGLYNEAEIRELYVDFPVGERTKVRFGKQQVAWGETDFFAANDLVHGFNLTWRSFLEPANEELRKPNIMAKINVDVPELDGGVEVLIRPGWDRDKDIGTELDIYGGRWSSQPYAGVDFRNIDPYDYKNKEGNYRKVTGGVRWSGVAKDINYSLSYLNTFYPSPILNASSTLGLFGMPTTPSGATTVGRSNTFGVAGDIIYPVVDVFGLTASGYSNLADAVFSTEIALIKDAPYQILAATPTPISQAVAPGFDGIKRKDVLAWMLRMDKNIAATQTWLGTEKPMFFSMQLFDKWIQDYKREDGLLNSVGWGGRTKEHSFLLTGIFSLSYDNGRIRPEFVIGRDITYGGGFAVPSVTMELSKSLRWKVEYDKFWSDKWRDGTQCTYPNAANCDNAGLFGYFHKRDQLYTSLTYLF
ncbi:MAG: LysR family transcriptional regulator [Zoogloea sp.]|nr:LysR family transcriptional regulator [Zoogloea sp.]MCA0184969.1 LysR family transcriptional regulator [Pseudomonadota bacterium]